MIATISKQGGRRYPQFGSAAGAGAVPLRLTGTSETVLPAGALGWIAVALGRDWTAADLGRTWVGDALGRTWYDQRQEA